MNIIFWLLILSGLFLIWLGLSDLFKPIGHKVHEIAKETKDIIEEK